MYDLNVIRITVLVLVVVGSVVDAKPFSNHRPRKEHEVENNRRYWYRPAVSTASTMDTTPFLPPISTSRTPDVPATVPPDSTSTRPPYSTTWAQKEPSTASVMATPSTETVGTDWPATSDPIADSTLQAATIETMVNNTTTATPFWRRSPDVLSTTEEVTQDPPGTTWTEMMTPLSTDPTDDFFDAETTEDATSTTPLVFTTPQERPVRTWRTFVEKSAFEDAVMVMTRATDPTVNSPGTTPSLTTEIPKSDDVNSIDQPNNVTTGDNEENITNPSPSITTEPPKPIDRFRETMLKAIDMVFDSGENTTDSDKPLMTTQEQSVGPEEVTTTQSPSIETVTVIDFTTHPPTEETTDAFKNELRKTLGPKFEEVTPETVGHLEHKLEMVMQQLREASDATEELFRQIGQQVNTLDEKVNQYIARPKTWKNCIQRPVDARKWLTADRLELFCENGEFMTKIELRRGPLGTLSVECCIME